MSYHSYHEVLRTYQLCKLIFQNFRASRHAFKKVFYPFLLIFIKKKKICLKFCFWVQEEVIVTIGIANLLVLD